MFASFYAEVSDDEEDDDHDMFMVPEIIDDNGLKPANDVITSRPEKRGRKHNTADREHKKIKRYTNTNMFINIKFHTH